MNDLRTLKIEFESKEKETVDLRLDIQKRIRDGETTGRLAIDYALAAGIPADEKTLAEIEKFLAVLKAHAGESVAVVFAKRLRAANEGKPDTEVRLGVLPASPAFRFDETGNGWTLGERYAVTTAAERAEDVREERLCYGSTTGIAYPNPGHRLVVLGTHVGNAAVAEYFRSGAAFGPLDHQALSEKIGIPLPTLKLPRTPTWKGTG